MGRGGSLGAADDERVQRINDAIRVIPDFPKVGGWLPTALPPALPPSPVYSVARGQRNAAGRCALPAGAPPSPRPCAAAPPPQPGIQFQDVTTILLDPVAFKHTIDMLVERYQGQQVDVVAGGRAALGALARRGGRCRRPGTWSLCLLTIDGVAHPQALRRAG